MPLNQFTVPQFIDVEDKIFGPITARQFVILLADGILLFVFYKLFDLVLFIFMLAVFGGFGLVLAFVKINGQPFHYFLLNIAQTLRRPALRVWDKTASDQELKLAMQLGSVLTAQVVKAEKKEFTRSRLADLSLVVNTGGMYKPDEESF
ncbi:MAG: PrgI family protein [Candidatus Magasanikbacteria bacterium]|nr:PrgI family protein [Candidatus Magasanikbacteria bacterium]